jgi:hypothetical protein
VARTTGPRSSIGSPITLMMRPSVSGPTGTVIGSAGVDDLLAAHQAVGGVHGDGAHHALAQVLRHLEHQALAVVGRFRARSGSAGSSPVELNVHHRAHHLGDLADEVSCHLLAPRGARRPVRGAACNPPLHCFLSGNNFDQFLGDRAWRVRL